MRVVSIVERTLRGSLRSRPLPVVAVCVYLFSAVNLFAADETTRIGYYLRKDSPLTGIERALGITRIESRSTARLTGIPQGSPAAIQRYGQRYSWGRLFEGWRNFGEGRRLFGVRDTYSPRRLFGTRTRVTPQRLYGVVAERTRRNELGSLAFRWGQDRELLFRNQPRPRAHEIYGPQFTSRRTLLEKQRWRPSQLYGSGLGTPRDRLYSVRRNDLGMRRLSRVNVSGASRILDRGRFGRRGSLSGRRLFGL
jgi:hypothetical protein